MRFRRVITVVIRVCVLACVGLAGVFGSGISDLQAHEEDRYREQRALFSKVERALKTGDYRPLQRHAHAQAAYPLYPYLAYQELFSRLPRVSDRAIEAFLERYGDEMPLADRLRHRWLGELARRGHWRKFLRHYRESLVFPSKDNRCNHALALIRTRQTQRAQELIRTLWMVDFSQPAQCDPVFRYGFEQGIISDELVWGRALLVLKGGQLKLANYLGSKLQGEARRWFRFLRQVPQDPQRVVLAMYERLSDSSYACDVLVFAMRRLIRQDVVRAGEVWHSIESGRDRCQPLGTAEVYLGIAAAKHLMPERAYRWLSRIPRENHTQTSRYWRIRAALRAGMWRQVLVAIDDLEPAESALPQWRYWRARAFAALGRHREARLIWQELARDDGYYGYLSADELNQAYPYAFSFIGSAAGDPRALDTYPATARIRELLFLGRPTDAGRELLVLLERFDGQEKIQFAAMADHWQWPIGAIRSLADNEANRRFLERFPMPYLDLVRAESRRSNMPMEWIYGVMRRESAFVEDIKSHAGALGLMQLLPRTARSVASRLGMKSPSTYGILFPKTNIRLGTTYLAGLYRKNGNNFAVSLASYNAGPTNARRWLNTAPVSDSAIWIDTIPFTETRRYVRAVLFYTLVYRHRLGKPPMRLRQLMRVD